MNNQKKRKTTQKNKHTSKHLGISGQGVFAWWDIASDPTVPQAVSKTGTNALTPCPKKIYSYSVGACNKMLQTNQDFSAEVKEHSSDFFRSRNDANYIDSLFGSVDSIK